MNTRFFRGMGMLALAIVAILALAMPQAYAQSGVRGTNNGWVFEGATQDAYEATVTMVDPTADRTQYFPNRSGYYQMASAGSALTAGAAVTLTVGQSNVYTLTQTDNTDGTITFSGAGTSGDEISILFTTTGTGDEVITFHSTLVKSTGTLTLGTTADRYYVVRFISNGTLWYEVSRTAVQS